MSPALRAELSKYRKRTHPALDNLVAGIEPLAERFAGPRGRPVAVPPPLQASTYTPLSPNNSTFYARQSVVSPNYAPPEPTPPRVLATSSESELENTVGNTPVRDTVSGIAPVEYSTPMGMEMLGRSIEELAGPQPPPLLQAAVEFEPQYDDCLMTQALFDQAMAEASIPGQGAIPDPFGPDPFAAEQQMYDQQLMASSDPFMMPGAFGPEPMGPPPM